MAETFRRYPAVAATIAVLTSEPHTGASPVSLRGAPVFCGGAAMTRFLAAAALALALGIAAAVAQTPVVYCQVGTWGRLASTGMCNAIRRAAEALNWPPLKGVAIWVGIDTCAHDFAGIPPSGQTTTDQVIWLDRGRQVCDDILSVNASHGSTLPVR